MDSNDGLVAPPSSAVEPAFLASLLPVLRRMVAVGFRVPVADREDVVQDALVAFLQYGQSHPVSPGLLVRITQRRCRDYWRSVARRREVSLDVVVAQESSHPATAPDACAGLQLLVAWRLLSPRCRDYLARRFWRSERIKQIAASEGKKDGAIQRFAARCLARLRATVTA
jgi:DNA-directed RNA polymerase specialized sigma24 family protein